MKWLSPLFLLFILIGCTNQETTPVTEGATTPEEALKFIDETKEEREIKVYSSRHIRDTMVLIAFTGAMNESDIWVADVRQSDSYWTVEKLYQMNGPLEEINDEEIVFTTDHFELGYVLSNAEALESEGIITIDPEKDWRILIRDLNMIAVTARIGN
ncbi:hypothetical protein [Gracilibacillus xinjiangensis]|uniref:Lipoprotein n=1 Tax=Gracilibacillus xinjiangensis TaxID=1193282 RepID=A0ABV8WX04_9BACI